MGAPSRTLAAELLGRRFQFQVAPGLFSADRVDDGTRLLLDHLPPVAPDRVLDLGCGYGALGLPVAARFPGSTCLLVDRLTPAVDWARRNAAVHGLSNVETRPSLGYRELDGLRFDWVLCNVPARIGDPALEYLLAQGASRLGRQGALRAVVIRDLAPRVESLGARQGWRLERCAEGPRHVVFSLPPREPAEDPVDHESIYLRDEVKQLGLSLQRPYDISEEPGHVAQGLPLLLELLPRAAGQVAVWRGGYGAAALILTLRGGVVLAADPDLLATTFSRRNGRRHQVSLRTAEAATLAEAFADPFDLFVGEIPTTLEPDAAAADIVASTQRLASGGQALWLGHTRRGQRVIPGGQAPLATRGAYSVWRLTPTSKAG